MNKNELKKMLKPVIIECIREGLREENSLIRECVREVIFEDGTISKLINETLRGLGSVSSVLSESKRSSKSKVQVLGDLTPETTLEEDEMLAEQEMKKRTSRVHEVYEHDKRELLAHREAKRKTMEKMLGSTGLPLEIFESVDVSSLPKGPNVSAGTRNKAGGVADIGTNPRGKGDGNAAMPLRGIDPNDAGIPITGILKLVGGSDKWTSQLRK